MCSLLCVLCACVWVLNLLDSNTGNYEEGFGMQRHSKRWSKQARPLQSKSGMMLIGWLFCTAVLVLMIAPTERTHFTKLFFILMVLHIAASEVVQCILTRAHSYRVKPGLPIGPFPFILYSSFGPYNFIETNLVFMIVAADLTKQFLTQHNHQSFPCVGDILQMWQWTVHIVHFVSMFLDIKLCSCKDKSHPDFMKSCP